MQVIFPLFRSVNASISWKLVVSCAEKVVLIYTLWVVGMASSIRWSASRSASGSPPVNTKSQ